MTLRESIAAIELPKPDPMEPCTQKQRDVLASFEVIKQMLLLLADAIEHTGVEPLMEFNKPALDLATRLAAEAILERDIVMQSSHGSSKYQLADSASVSRYNALMTHFTLPPGNYDYMRLAEIPMQRRVRNILTQKLGIHTLGDLARHTSESLFDFWLARKKYGNTASLGASSEKWLRKVMNFHYLTFAGERIRSV